MLALFISILVLIVLFYYKPLSSKDINYLYFLKKVSDQKEKKPDKKKKDRL